MVRQNDFITQIGNHIGEKVFNLRLGMGLSRKELAALIGVSHQQLQKYEKGVNRISVGRLLLVAKALEKDIEYFYEDFIENQTIVKTITKHQRMCIELSKNFMKIQDSEHQTAINTLVKTLAKELLI
jgi:transcriptional regulator with XRE-family HTH domain